MRDALKTELVLAALGMALSKREIIRCLKRYIARETYQLLTTEAST